MSFPRADGLWGVDCDVGHVAGADLVTVDALARAHLNACRLGDRLRVVNATAELEELIGFAGLADVLLRRLERQPEQGEQPPGVEERREADDPTT
jgi:hypothetical protein